MTAAKLTVELVLIIAIGILVRKKNIVSENFGRQLSSLLTNLLLPCMIINSMRGSASLSDLKNCAILLVLSLITFAIELPLAQGAYIGFGKGSTGRTARFSLLYTNFTFMGIPVVEALYGPQGVFYFVVFIVPARIFYYSSLKPLLSPPGVVHEKQTLLQHIKGWLSPPLLAVIVGATLYFGSIPLPSVLSDVIQRLGSICSALGMLLCGLTLGDYPIRRLLRKEYLLIPLLRTLLMPALLFLVTRFLPFPAELTRLMVIYAALPIPSMLTAFSLQYEPEKEAHFEAAGVVLLSTFFSALTLPVWAWLLTL